MYHKRQIQRRAPSPHSSQHLCPKFKQYIRGIFTIRLTSNAFFIDRHRLLQHRKESTGPQDLIVTYHAQEYRFLLPSTHFRKYPQYDVAEKEGDDTVRRHIRVSDVVFVGAFCGSEGDDRPDGIIGYLFRNARRLLGPVCEFGHSLDHTFGASSADGVLEIREADIEEDVA